MPYIAVRTSKEKLNYEEVCSQLHSSELIFKPALSGASIGITVVRSAIEFDEVLPQTVKLYGETVIEPLLRAFRELSITVHNFDGYTQALDVCELMTGGELFDFDMKNGYHPIRKQLPANLSIPIAEKLQTIAASIYDDIGLESIARVDVLLDQDENIHVLEANTLPGLMPQSVAPAAVLARGMTYRDLIQNILVAALCKKRFGMTKQTEDQPRLSESVSL